jgi:hypothetical protein
VKKLSKSQIEPIAFEFAKSIVSNNPDIENRDLVSKSYKLAINWLESEKQKDEILIQTYPNWIDLRAVNRYEMKESHKFGSVKEHYWFVKERVGDDGEKTLVVDKGELDSATYDRDDIYNFIFISSDNKRVRGLFVLDKENGEKFTDDFKPLPPSEYQLERKPSLYSSVG